MALRQAQIRPRRDWDLFTYLTFSAMFKVHLGSESGSMTRKTHSLIVLFAVLLALILGTVLMTGPVPAPHRVPVDEPPSTVGITAEKSTESSDAQTAPADAMLATPFSGHVWSTRGRPIPAARVELQAKDVVLSTTATDDSGAYVLADVLPRAAHVLVASADGYHPSDQPLDDSVQLTKSIDFFLRPSSSISGFVEDQNHRPLPGFVVSGKGSDGHIARSPSTKGDGRFELDGFEEGSVSIWTAYVCPLSFHGVSGLRPFYEEGKSTVELRKGEHRDGVRLMVSWDTEAAIAGSVVTDEGKPLSGVQVIALGPGGPFLSACLSDTQGLFRLENLVRVTDDFEEVTHVIVRADCEGYESFWNKSVAVGTPDLVITMTRIRGGRIVGTVLDKITRAPVTNAHVCVTENRMPDGRLRPTPPSDFLDIMRSGETRVDPEGRFRISSVPPGRVSFLVYAPEYGMSHHENIEVKANRDSEVEVLLEASGLLRVHVVYVGDLEGRETACTIFYKREEAQEWDPFFGLETDILLSGGKGSSGIVGPKTYEMRLQPGRYQVAVQIEACISPTVSGSVNLYAFSADVRSGETTDLRAPVGGLGVVQGSSAPNPEGKRRLLIMVPGSVFPEEAIAYVTNIYEILRHTGGQAMTAHATPDYEFNCIPEGTWTVGAFVISEDGETVNPRGFQTFQIREGDRITWDFP